MKPPFLLCDPGLLLVPDEDAADAPAFWARMINWSVDRRVRLGPQGHALVLAQIEQQGWPNFEPPACPKPLERLSRRALSVLLSQVAVPSQPQTEVTPRTLVPAYSADARVEPVIGADAAQLNGEGLVGLATDVAHWAEPVDVVKVAPPPPEELWLAVEPMQRLATERETSVATYLRDKRLTVIGGLQDLDLVETWRARFHITTDQVRWIESEKGQRLNLQALHGLQQTIDVVYCVTGRIGHAGSGSARDKCVKRGIELRYVAQANAIADDLIDRHG